MALFRKDPEEGIEQKVDDDKLDPDQVLAAARESQGYLNTLTKGSLAKYVRGRWDRLETQARRIQVELKVNHHRFNGESYAQVNPRDPNRVWMPYGSGQRTPPTINKIRRAVHRYVAQTTADEPIIEGVPANHTDEARDQAEAATDALRGEWHRMNLHRHLQRASTMAAIFRSGFWLFSWDETAGGRTKAQKFFKNPETGENELAFVNGSGERVEDETEAAEIWEGNAAVETLTPFNVRWTGGEYAHEADELMVAKIVRLEQLYEMDPGTKDAKLDQLIGQVPSGAEEWLNDIRGADGLSSWKDHGFDDEILAMEDGHSMSDEQSKLDAPVMLLYYFKKPSRSYRKGFSALVAGKHLVTKGPLRYGVMPVVQFKLLDDPTDPLGLGLVDLLKDPQELLDFVNGQILRFLQTMRRRWFVPLASGVKTRDLLNPTRSVIHYNPNGGAPTPEQHGELPQSLTDVVDRYDTEFDDELGIHDTMQGKHVPGVSSGRHAEALRTGDETVLGLTRIQIEEALEAAGRIILEIAKKEWSTERKISYFEGREYIEKAFSGADFGSTAKTRLKKGTLLMLTPAQKLETLFGYAEMGAITTQELRKLAPLSDTAGISVTEDPHYQRARRENSKFLAGPDDDLKKKREDYEENIRILSEQLAHVQTAVDLGAMDDQEAGADVEIAIQKIQAEVQEVEAEWQAELAKYAPSFQGWEQFGIEASGIHMTEHLAALARDKVRRLPNWWVDPFVQHLQMHVQVIQSMQQQEQAGQQQEPQA